MVLRYERQWILTETLGLFWTLVRVFFKKTLKQIKLKTNFFLENCGHIVVENVIILTCAKIQRKVLMFGEVGAPESSFWD